MAAMSAASSAAPHDCIRAVQHYINKILKPRDKAKEISGMKCLLLDKETKSIVAMAYSMNDILAREVYLVESLDGAHESLGHMKAIVLTRPTHDNVRELVALLKEPKFLEYHIFFTNIVPQVRARTHVPPPPPRAAAPLTPRPAARRTCCASSRTPTTWASCGRCRSSTRTFTR